MVELSSNGQVFHKKNEMSDFARTIMRQKYAHTKPDGTKEEWSEIAMRVTKNVLGALKINESNPVFNEVYSMIRDRKFIPGGRYLYASGRDFHQVQNCLLLRAEDSREGWADLLHRASMALMTGAGIGVDYSLVRPEGSLIKRTGGFATGPLALMQMLNEAGRHIMQGGARRSAIWAGLNWKHQDIFKFIAIKNWSEEVKAQKAKDFNAYAPMDGTNISILLDDLFFEAIFDTTHTDHTHALKVYKTGVRQMLENGEPGFSVDVGQNASETLRNACTEVTSADDDDICNLGSINMARVSSVQEMARLTELGTLFLLAGTVYSHIPYEKVGQTREKNRRLGLGLMGIAEWLHLHGYGYEPNDEMAKYLEEYAKSGDYAAKFAAEFGLSVPVKTRACAPTGTIGIVAETTTGCEPIFAVAYKRRYLDGQVWKYQYVVDPTAKRLVDAGVDPDTIEDSYSIASNPERRVAFQAWLQKYIDHGVSSTINMPAWGSKFNNESLVDEFATMLLGYLPMIRGITVYPDGSRGGQPLTPVPLSEALLGEGQIFYESVDICDITKGGSCGG